MSIKIGDKNKIKNTNIIDKIEGGDPLERKKFYDKHPILCGIFISIVAGIILLMFEDGNGFLNSFK